MKNVDISVIIPLYNKEKYIEKCITSVLNQTLKNIEIIIVNDGSTDKSEEIVKSFEDNRIKYYKNKNQGIGKTRNFGIEKATGKYLMFLDSDDSYEANTCEEFFNRCEKDNLDLAVCDFYKVFDDGKKIEDKFIDFKDSSIKDNPNLLSKINAGPCNKIFKTSIIKDNNICFEENLKYEDTPFVLTSLDKAKKVGKINKCLYNYLIHSNSETTVRDERCFDILKIVMQIRKYFSNKEYATEEINKWTVRTITNYTIQQRYQVKKKISDKFIDEAFELLKREVPDYKSNKYYEGRGIRRLIEKNIYLTKIYCNIYRLLKNKN